jgi:hypothetical protein
MAKAIMRLAQMAGVSIGSSTILIVLSSDREQAAAHDYHYVGDREGHMPE